jgi:hypothetical protein
MSPTTAQKAVNIGGDDSRSKNRSVMSVVSEETNSLASYVGANTANHQSSYSTGCDEYCGRRFEKMEKFRHARYFN